MPACSTALLNLFVCCQVVTIDNLVNSHSGALKRVQDITGKSVIFYECDLLDSASVNLLFTKVKQLLNIITACRGWSAVCHQGDAAAEHHSMHAGSCLQCVTKVMQQLNITACMLGVVCCVSPRWRSSRTSQHACWELLCCVSVVMWRRESLATDISIIFVFF